MVVCFEAFVVIFIHYGPKIRRGYSKACQVILAG